MLKTITCECKTPVPVPEEASIGDMLSCPVCGKLLTVPRPDAMAAPEPASEPAEASAAGAEPVSTAPVPQAAQPGALSATGGMPGSAFPVKFMVPVAALAVVFLGYWFFSTEGARREIREAKRAIAGIGPAEMAEKLFAGEDLPDAVPIEVRGVLDISEGYYEYEHLMPSTYGGDVTFLSSLKVYGLLYPADSRVLTERNSLITLAQLISGYQARYPDIDFDEYNELWDQVVETQREITAGSAAFIELDKDSYPLLYEDVEKEILDDLNRPKGRILHPDTAMEMQRQLIKRLLKSENVREGAFKVQLVEHNRELAAEVKSDDSTKKLDVIRTVKEIRR